MSHWLPYDERQLLALLGIDRAALGRWLEDDDVHTVAQLVRRRGLEPHDVSEQLVDAWAEGASPSRRSALRDRAMRTLTEGHLAQHMFFHLAHYPSVALQARTVFGVSPLGYQQLRLGGRTPREIARRAGIAGAEVRRRTMPILRQGARTGVTAQQMPPAQARRLLRLQRANLSAWLDQRIRPLGARPRLRPPRLRSEEELACWLFAGPDGLAQVRPRAASLVCALQNSNREERE